MAEPNVQTGKVDRANAEQVAPTMAKLLGLDVNAYPQQPIVA